MGINLFMEEKNWVFELISKNANESLGVIVKNLHVGWF